MFGNIWRHIVSKFQICTWMTSRIRLQRSQGTYLHKNRNPNPHTYILIFRHTWSHILCDLPIFTWLASRISLQWPLGLDHICAISIDHAFIWTNWRQIVCDLPICTWLTSRISLQWPHGTNYHFRHKNLNPDPINAIIKQTPPNTARVLQIRKSLASRISIQRPPGRFKLALRWPL